jgi:hypothetical protein
MNELAATWQVEGKRAALSCGPLAGIVALDDKRVHFIANAWNDQRVTGSAMFMSYCGAPNQTDSLLFAETYVRGHDFVATFAESGPHRVAPQTYWRASFVKKFATAKLELVLSVKTDLLDSEPTSFIESTLNTEASLLHSGSLDVPRFAAIETRSRAFDASTSAEHLFVVRCRSLGFSYAEMVHPTDFVSAEIHVHAQTSVSLSTRLFPEHLEKGVIRRGRICSWFMPIENDLETAVALARQFVEEPLPLTT